MVRAVDPYSGFYTAECWLFILKIKKIIIKIKYKKEQAWNARSICTLEVHVPLKYGDVASWLFISKYMITYNEFSFSRRRSIMLESALIGCKCTFNSLLVLPHTERQNVTSWDKPTFSIVCTLKGKLRCINLEHQ